MVGNSLVIRAGPLLSPITSVSPVIRPDSAANHNQASQGSFIHLSQLGVFGAGLLEDGDAGPGDVAQAEETWTLQSGFGGVAMQRVGAEPALYPVISFFSEQALSSSQT